MMSKEILKEILEIKNRHNLFKKILLYLKDFSSLDKVDYFQFETSEGIIPLIKISKSIKTEKVEKVKVFVGAQHNEYNGLFGIIEFLNRVKSSDISLDDLSLDNQILYFAPLMNPYGFLNPRKENKSGYYLKNGSNLNRFWRSTFAPEYKIKENKLNLYRAPVQTEIIKGILDSFWKRKNIRIYILDFHETSLLKRFIAKLKNKLGEQSITYKFSHWLEEEIIRNIIHLNELAISKKPLFYKCNPNADHTHLSLSFKQVDILYEKLLEYIDSNKEKLPFYLCYSDKSKEFCERLASNIYYKLKDILWETKSPAMSHYFDDHGCFVNMNDAIQRSGVFSMELEAEKHFFDIFEEIHRSKTEPNYFKDKCKMMNLSIELVVGSIREMVNLD